MVNNANSAATSSPSQTQVVVPMASAQFSSPSVELTTSSPQAHVVQMASPQPRHPSRHILENKSTLSLCPILFYAFSNVTLATLLFSDSNITLKRKVFGPIDTNTAKTNFQKPNTSSNML